MMNWLVLAISVSLSSVGLFLLWRMERLRSPKSSITRKVSIVIPARNEVKRILPLLQSIQAQASLIHEYIVVDDIHYSSQNQLLLLYILQFSCLMNP